MIRPAPLPHATTLAVLLPLLGGAGDAPAQAVLPAYTFVDTATATGPQDGAGRAFLYSLVLPGAGQYRLDRRRWAAYAAVELWAWLRYRDRRSDGRELERRYRDLAWSVARDTGVGPRRDGDFEYYEALGRYVRSGAFDRDPAREGIQPEQDETTFNGSIWALARAIYIPAGLDSLAMGSAAYDEALAYYRSRAVPPAFAWSWDGHEPERRAYGELIDASDEAVRSATRTLGLILANHVVSAVDALISARLSGPEDAEPPVRIEGGIEWRGREPVWLAVVRIPWPGR